VLVSLLLAVLYWGAPNVKVPFRLISPGSLLAVLGWVLASLGFAFYVAPELVRYTNSQGYGSRLSMYQQMSPIPIVLSYYRYCFAKDNGHEVSLPYEDTSVFLIIPAGSHPPHASPRVVSYKGRPHSRRYR
jgi:hypothetical protein